MKKTVKAVGLLVALSLLVCSLTGCVTSKQKENIRILEEMFSFSEPEVFLKKGQYTVVCPVSFDSLPRQTTQTEAETRQIYSGWQQARAYTALDTCVIALARKQGGSQQVISFDAALHQTGFYTETPLRLEKVFYGNAAPNDIVTVKENAAVFLNEKGAKQLYTGGERLIQSDKAYLVCLKTSRDMQTHSGAPMYTHFSYNCVYPLEPIEGALTAREALIWKIIEVSERYDRFTKYENFADFDKIGVELAEQYLIPEAPDTRLDRKEESLKLLKVIPGSEYQSEEKKALEAKSEAELLNLLTKKQRTLLDEMVARYGKKTS